MYSAIYDEEWPDYFDKLSNEMKERTTKKIQKILEYPQKRHLQKEAKFFVGTSIHLNFLKNYSLCLDGHFHRKPF